MGRLLFSHLLTCLFLLSLCLAQNIEDCSNAVDDDQDGLIDLLDPDCVCEDALPPSPIPNPSFEDQSACPYAHSLMTFVESWIQPSEATTDYSHACGWQEWLDIALPRPLPDGDACLGLRDGYSGIRGVNPNWKEYAAACLDEPLRAGVFYTFSFYVGFADIENSPATSMQWFGTPHCEDISFGIDDGYFGCPTNDPDWQLLGAVNVSGENEWKRYEMTIQTTVDIGAIAIGPSCAAFVGESVPYHFIDHITLIEQSDFDPEVALSAHPCADEVSLEVTVREGYSYQWYKDGIALLGEEQAQLSSLYGEGIYQVRMQGPLGQCEQTEPFLYEETAIYAEFQQTICEEESYQLGDQFLNETGVYVDTLTTPAGCDSIVRLELTVASDLGGSIEAKIFPNEFYQLDKYRYYQPGQYILDLTSSSGCDSTLTLTLSYYELHAPTAFSPNGDGVNDTFSLIGGEDVKAITSFTVFNRWGNRVYEEAFPSALSKSVAWDGYIKGQLAQEDVYVFVAKVLFDDNKERRSSGSFVLLR